MSTQPAILFTAGNLSHESREIINYACWQLNELKQLVTSVIQLMVLLGPGHLHAVHLFLTL
jgi:hypothetical protein